MTDSPATNSSASNSSASDSPASDSPASDSPASDSPASDSPASDSPASDSPASDSSASYKAAGVDYDALDAGKRMAMARAVATSSLLTKRGGHAHDASRGEPAFVFDFGGRTFAFVVEGLGTKSIVARLLYERHGSNRFADVAYDTVAAILNDLACVGALPLVVNAYFATGASEWYGEADRAIALLEGWQRACVDAGCTWGGGESPSLSGLLASEDIELAGAAVGAVPAGASAILGEDLAAGDEIVLVASSGLHANGASLARLVAARLPHGYATALPSGRLLGEALLDPSVMYVPLVQALLESDLKISYLSHVTGHGLLKLMRPSRSFTYRVSELLPSRRSWRSLSIRLGWTHTPRTPHSTWAPATPSTAPPEPAPRSSPWPENWAWMRL